MKNIGTGILNLSNVSFTDGITFSFGDNADLAPGEFVLVVANQVAFESRYAGLTNIFIAAYGTGPLTVGEDANRQR